MAFGNPFGNFHFLVEIDGIPQAGFAEVSGLGVEITPIEYREGGSPGWSHKIPGVVKYSNVVLKRGLADIRLWNWIQTIVNGKIQRSTVVVVMLDEARKPVARFVLRQAWPCKWEGPSFRAKGNEVALETLELCHEEFDIEFV